MLRAEFSEAVNTLRLRLEGRLVGEFAEDVRSLVARCTIPPGLVIDLTDVTYVDVTGEDVLTWLGRLGGKFVAGNCYSLDICERLHLPLVPRRIGPLSPAV
jgi:hypothetical protein